MEKRTISIINLILSIFVFLCIFGNTCYHNSQNDIIEYNNDEIKKSLYFNL